MNITDIVKKHIRSFPPYVPGEQTQDPSYIKLNTNESPHPIPDAIIHEASINFFKKLNLYPEATSDSLRSVAGNIYGLQPENVIVGNGSSDILSLVYRTFVDEGDIIAMPSPGFALNRDLAAIQGGKLVEVGWDINYALPLESLLRVQSKIIVIANPNNPTGVFCPLDEIQELAKNHKGLLVLDEAYVDFTDQNGLEIFHKYNNVVILRSFSKSCSAAGIRLGMAFAPKQVTEYLRKAQGIYSIGRPTQALGLAILNNIDLFEPLIKSIKEQRQITFRDLCQRGFQCIPSETNFIFARVPVGSGGLEWYEELKKRKILVRHFSDPGLEGFLRITIGRPEDMSKLITEIDSILAT